MTLSVTSHAEIAEDDHGKSIQRSVLRQTYSQLDHPTVGF